MKLTPSKLKSRLKDNLSCIYIIFGNDFLQNQQLVDRVFERAKKEDYLEKETHLITDKYDWSFLKHGEESKDLFGSKKVIVVKLLENGPGREGAKILKEYSSNIHKENILIVSAEGLDYKSRSSVWAKALDSVGITITIDPITSENLPSWIQKIGMKYKVKISKELAYFLAEKTEGNLLSSFQEIKKLALVYREKDITLEDIAREVSNSSRFTIFDFSNSFISLNKKRMFQILESLKDEGTPEALILWALSKEIKNLSQTIQQGSTKGIWGSKKYIYMLEKASEKISTKRLLRSLKKLAIIDASIKGRENQKPWTAIRDFCLNF